MKLDQLETFLWVATLGSFRKAAERLNTTQPAVSSRISALELTLGSKLFERGARRVTLTAFGQTIVPYAEKVIYMADQLRLQSVEAEANAGVLRLGVSETIVHTWLPDFLRRAHEMSPGLSVELSVDVTVNLRDELAARSLDLAILLGPVSVHEIDNLQLCSYPLVWAASPQLGLGGGSHSVESLARHRILTFARNTRPYVEIRNRLRRADGPPARISPSSSLAAIKRMAADSLGVAVLPMATIRNEIDSGQLQVLDCDWQPSDLVFTASWPTVPFRPALERFAQLAAVAAAGFAADR